MPVALTTTEIIKHHAKQLVGILKDELEHERGELHERLHARTLERIFIEERIYKKIETMKTAEGVVKAVIAGFEPFKKELIRAIIEADVKKLLEIPIRRISLYDINKNREEVQAINARLAEIAKLLKNLTAYAVNYLNGILAKLDKTETARKSTITTFKAVDVKEVVKRDTPVLYDEKSGYLGTGVTQGIEQFRITPFDRVIFIRKNGYYTVETAPEKVFVDSGLWYSGLADKESISQVLFTVVYRDPKTKFAFIKRCRIEQYIMNRDYCIVPEGMEVLFLDTRPKFSFTLHYAKKPRIKTLKEVFKAHDFAEKGLKALGARLKQAEVESAEANEK
jgi:topoisomerase-4 subunit A